MADSPAEPITVYSDYVCPFCYLGRESLSRYQESREEDLEIDWHPFDLRSGKRNPDGSIDHSVDDGKDDDYYEQAKENVRRLQERYDAEMELDLATEVDSLPAQVVSYHLKGTHPYGTWLAFDEAVFDALWTEGRDIGDSDVLEELAEAAGVDRGVVEEALADDDLRERVRERFSEAKRQGVTGVPTFVYEGYAARGAVPPEQLERLVEGSG
ncbi:DsbA family oxidoreductase [Salinirubellus sp. GCM10025818]|jgi:predicted DsbA family dithiol-disulfide isomerase|uniref:DsbA family oxidoreductase n=1 Tax=Salinirubellus TaxID=2162630 RepID=UPI0030D118EB